MEKGIRSRLMSFRSSPVFKLPRAMWRRVFIVWTILLGLIAVYWVQLYVSQQNALEEARQQARLRASQTAQALTYQTESMLRKLNFIVQHLGEHWQGQDDAQMRHVLRIAMDSVARGTILEVLIADAHGQVVFSSLQPPGRLLAPVSVVDRDFFQAHLGFNEPHLHIGIPGRQHIFGQWTAELSRPILDADGNLAYVIAASISAAHLAEAFQRVFPDPQDVVMLLDSEGRYLTRTHGLDQAMGGRVPADRDFLRFPQLQSGVYEARAAVDGVTRYYAWQRIPKLPLVLSLGLGRDKVMAPLERSQRMSQIHNLISTLLLLLAAGSITRLVLLRAVQQRNLEKTQRRLRQTLQAARDGLWHWEVDSGRMHWDALCHDMMGWPQGGLPTDYAQWCQLLHPDERVVVQAALECSDSSPQRLECRVRGHDGRWHWVELRGQMVTMPGGGGSSGRGAGPAQARQFMGTCSDISERVAAAQLRQALLERSTAAIFLVTPERRILHANAQARELFARPGQTLEGTFTSSLHVSASRNADIKPYYEQLRTQGQVRLKYPLRDATGAIRWFDMQAVPSQPGDPESTVVWTLIDITEGHQAAQALEAQHLRLVTLLEQFQAGVLLEDADGHVVMANSSLCHLLVLRTTPAQLQGIGHDSLVQQIAPQRAAWLELPQHEPQRSLEVSDVALGRHLWLQWLPITHQGAALGQIWLLHDITERKLKEQELATLASTDALTGLPNRRSFLAMLEQYLAVQPTTRAGGAILALDVDHFKRVNDTWGHPVGDLVLKHVAQVVRQNLRASDYPGRLGGEEFCVLVRHATKQDAVQLAERIRQALASQPAPVGAEVEGGQVQVTISIGVAALTGQESHVAMAQADKALYQAKSTGRNRVCLADDGAAGVPDAVDAAEDAAGAGEAAS